MDLQQRISDYFEESIDCQRQSIDTLTPLIGRASELLVESLLHGGRVLCCGAGAPSALAQYTATLLIHRYRRERPGLPAITLPHDIGTLTAVACEHGYHDLFAHSLRTLGHEDDVLLAIAGGDSCGALPEAVRAAHDKNMAVIALTAEDDNDIASLLELSDIEVRVPIKSSRRSQEIHLAVIHCLCDLVDVQIFGEEL